MTKTDIKDIARGRWREILAGLGGVDENFLADEHGPCPFCAGRDRWRWDDIDGNGGGYCNQCGGQNGAGGFISGPDILMRAKGWSFAEAAKQIKQFLGVETVTESVTRPFRQAEVPPADAAPPRLGRGAVAQWCYRLADGSQAFWVQRVNRRAGGKYFLLVIWLDGAWHTVTKRDPFRADWPELRPLYRLPQLLARPDAPVVIAEGEKSVDAAAQLLPGHVAIGFRNGAKSAGKSDWSPLAGREVVLLPDNDPDGDEFVLRVTQQLRKVGVASISVCRPDPDAPAKWDIADGLADGWGVADAELWLQGAELAAEPSEPSGPGNGADPVRWDRFSLLGFDDGSYFYHPHGAGQVVRLPRGAHTSVNLMALANESWWRDRWPRVNADGEVIGVKWQSVASDLFEAQHHVGVFDPKRIRGIGAWWDQGRPVVHLGDRLIVDGRDCDVREGPAGSEYIYQKYAAISGWGGVPALTDQQGVELLELLEAFNWEEQSAGMLLAGWIMDAVICGTLHWRPHVWVTAPSGSGKSTLIDRVILKLLGGMAIVPLGEATEAGIRQRLRSSALPVVYDEAESNEEADKARIQRILALARGASSDGQGEILKGTAGGEGISFAVRSMFLFCSIATSLKQGADRTRITKLTLQRATDVMSAEQAHRQWQQLDADLDRLITDTTGRALVARACALVGVVRDAAVVFRRACGQHLGSQRMGDQYGTLCAGAWALCFSTPPSDEQAAAWLQQYPLTSSCEDSVSQTDESSCLSTLLEYQLRVDTTDSGSHTRTIKELIDVVRGVAPLVDQPVGYEDAKHALGRLGVKVSIPERLVYVSNTAKAIKTRVLRETAWANCWADMLRRVPGAQRGGIQRFAELGPSRTVALPFDVVDGSHLEG